MKIRKQLALCIGLWVLCTAFSACNNAELTVPEDTSALENYIAETSAKAEKASEALDEIQVLNLNTDEFKLAK